MLGVPCALMQQACDITGEFYIDVDGMHSTTQCLLVCYGMMGVRYDGGTVCWVCRVR